MAKTFANTGNYNLGKNSATEMLLASFEGQVVTWVSKGGISSTRVYGSGTQRSMRMFHQRLCSIRGIGNFAGEAQNERESREAGKATLTVNDGTLFSSTLSVKGDDVYTLAALQGKNLHNVTADTFDFLAGIRYGGTFNNAGHLIITSFDGSGSAGNAQGSIVYPNVTVKFDEIRGLGDPETNVSVTLETTTQPYHFGNGVIAVPFMFLDDGTITNTDAPDGTLTAFAIKDANEAYGEASTPAGDLKIVPVDDTQTGIGKYIIDFRVDGSEVTSGVTIDQSTGTFTFSSAPADGAMIEGIVAVPTGFPTHTTGEVASVGTIREFNGAYYVANTTTTDLPSSADWDAVTLIDPPYWGTSPGGNSVHTSSHPQHPGMSWLDYNLFG
jgi:hypothetical protein